MASWTWGGVLEEGVDLFEVDGCDRFDAAIEAFKKCFFPGKEGEEAFFEGAPGLALPGLAQLVVMGFVDNALAFADGDEVLGDLLLLAVEDLDGPGRDEDADFLADAARGDGVAVAEDGDGAVLGDESFFDAGG
jgi:hypothetical protein